MAKTKALISFAVTAKLICVFVFAYTKCWFSHDTAQISFGISTRLFVADLISNPELGFSDKGAHFDTAFSDA